MNYLRYTFSLGFKLIMLVSLVIFLCFSITILSFGGDWFVALMVFLVWVAVVTVLMLVSFFHYLQYKKFTSNEKKQPHHRTVEEGRK